VADAQQGFLHRQQFRALVGALAERHAPGALHRAAARDDARPHAAALPLPVVAAAGAVDVEDDLSHLTERSAAVKRRNPMLTKPSRVRKAASTGEGPAGRTRLCS